MKANNPVEPGNNETTRLIPPEYKIPETHRNNFTAPLVLFLFVLLIIITGYVLIILPDLFKETPLETEKTVLEKTSPHPAVFTGNEGNTDEKPPLPHTESTEADTDLKNLFSIKIQAESENISEWAPEKYKAALEIAAHGDQLFKEHRYQDAAETYRKVVNDVSNILKSKQQIFTISLKKGESALANGHGEEALLYFKKALAIDPASREASIGRQRARTIDNVMEMHNQALLLEQSEDFSGARIILEKLLKIDPGYLPGKQDIKRVQKTIENHLFNSEMSLFFEFLEAGYLNRAKVSLDTLKSIRKEDSQVIQATEMFAAKKESARINSLQEKAEIFCKNEQWEKALAVYKQALAIAPEALFAVNGKEQAAKRLELDKALSYTISHPERLQDRTHREKTVKLLKYARTITPQGTRLESQTVKLQNLVVRAAAPVAVTIDSDNLTDITIYRVGRIGHFHSQIISLTPGKYTIVGSRQGFQDIRNIIVVDPDKTKHRFQIQCKDPI